MLTPLLDVVVLVTTLYFHPEIVQYLTANISFNKLLSFTNFLDISSRLVS